MQKQGWGVGGIIFLAIVGFLIWWFFIRVDYHDFWYSGTGQAYVTYCGPIDNQNCDAHSAEYLTVDHIEKAKSATTGNPLHTFKIHFRDGSSVEAEGGCYQAADGLSFDRVCYVDSVGEDGNWYRFEIHN